MNRRLSSITCRYYEFLIFIWLNFIIKTLMHFYCIMNGSEGVEEEIKKLNAYGG